MRGTRAKRIRQDVRNMIAENPEMWSKYTFHQLYKNAKRAWKQWNQ